MSHPLKFPPARCTSLTNHGAPIALPDYRPTKQVFIVAGRYRDFVSYCDRRRWNPWTLSNSWGRDFLNIWIVGRVDFLVVVLPGESLTAEQIEKIKHHGGKIEYA
jgi:hypothetical protein